MFNTYFPGWFKPGFQTQFAITANCLHAFLLFGYDQGVFGGLITNEDFLDIVDHPSEGFLGFIVSSYNLGCLSGCLINFAIGNRLGRRQALWIAMASLSAGAVLQTASYGVPQMIIGRIVTGIGVGIDTSTVPMYQAELCKSHVRGRLVTTEVLFTALGIAIAYFFAFGMDFVGGAIAWRLPIAIQILPAIVISIMLLGLPETPRWLIEKGRTEEAVEVMCKVYGTDPDDEYIVMERKQIIESLELERQSPFSWMNVFKKDRVQTGKRVLLACLGLSFNQWAGINVVVFYIATVLENNVGLSRNLALVGGGCINLAFAVGSLVPAIFLDKIGRRKPMILGTIGMGLSHMCISILLSFNGTDKERVTANASIAFFTLFMLFFGTSLNAIPWCYAPEIIPLQARAKGTSLAVCWNWIFVFTIVMVAPTMIANIAWKTYLVFMACNFAIAPTIYFFFPETNGLTLEEVDNIFIKDHIAPVASSSDSQYGEKQADAGKLPGSHIERTAH